VSNFRNSVQSSEYYIKYSWPFDIVVKWQQFMLILAVSTNNKLSSPLPKKERGERPIWNSVVKLFQQYAFSLVL
jgi:hypothetical protein